MSFPRKFKLFRLENVWPYAAVALPIFLFNLIAIFGLDTAIYDDLQKIRRVLMNDLDWQFYHLSQLLRYPFWRLLAISPQWPRLLIVVIWMIPISWLYYYLCRHLFKLNHTIAISAAIIPAILPSQFLIPAYIEGHYMLQAIFFLFLSLIFGLHYLEAESSSRIHLGLSILFFGAATRISEIAVFFFLPVTFIYFLFARVSKRQFQLLVPKIVFCGVIIKLVSHSQRARNTPVSHDIGEIFSRLKNLFVFSNPFGLNELNTATVITLLILTLAVIAGLLIYRRPIDMPGSKIAPFRFSHYQNYLLLNTFNWIWFGATAFTFIFFAKFFSSRYFYLSGFAFNLFIVMVLYSLLNQALHSRPRVIALVFIALVIFCGIQRYTVLHSFFQPYNADHKVFSRELSGFEFPDQSQIVIVGKAHLSTGGYWHWSSGYLQFVTGRNDLHGIFPHHYHFYNPFNGQAGRRWGRQMQGLDLNDPIFLFKREKHFQPVLYALQWLAPAKNSDWTFYQFNPKDGSHTIIYRGKGYSAYMDYIHTLKQAGIDQTDILFGGDPLAPGPNHFGF